MPSFSFRRLRVSVSLFEVRGGERLDLSAIVRPCLSSRGLRVSVKFRTVSNLGVRGGERLDLSAIMGPFVSSRGLLVSVSLFGVRGGERLPCQQFWGALSYLGGCVSLSDFFGSGVVNV